MARRHDSTVLFDQRDIAGAVRRRFWLVVLLAVIGAAAGAAYAHTKPVRYQATAQVIAAQPVSTTLLTTENAPSIDPKVLQATQIAIIQSDQIKNQVEKQFGKNLDVTFTAVSGSQLVAITAIADTADRAAAIANAYSKAEVGYALTQEQTQLTALQTSITAAIAEANARTAQLDAALVPLAGPALAAAQQSQATERAGLQQSIARNSGLLVSVQFNLVASSAPVSEATKATPPNDAISSGLVKLAILGLLLGAIIGFAGCVVLDARDDRLHSLDALEAEGATAWGAPGLAWHPHRETGWWYALEAPWSPLTEQWRLISERALIAARGGVILVTSVDVHGDPVAAALQMGAVLTERGLRVGVIEADVADTRMAHGLGLDPASVGLGDKLDRESPTAADLLTIDRAEGLRVLPVGAAKAAGVLDGDALVRYVHGLAASVDVVIVAAPPIDHYSVTAPLARVAGATLLLVAQHKTTVSGLTSALRVLGDFGTTTGVAWVSKEDILWSGDYGKTVAGSVRVTPSSPTGGTEIRSLPADTATVDAGAASS